MDFRQVREYIGKLDQVFAVKQYVLQGGRQEGVHAIDVSTGAGMELTILPDRCMDFYQLKLNGKGLNFLSPTGIVGPSYCGKAVDGWLPSFGGGFLTTCGMDNIGVGGEDQGEILRMHGSLSNTPAEQVSVCTTVEEGVPTVRISGVMRDATLFLGDVHMTRTVVLRHGINAFEFTDRFVNVGFSSRPLMLLYHFNMGYPLLDETAQLILPTNRVTPRTKHAADYVEQYACITPPSTPFEEMCYYHDIQADDQGMATVGLRNAQQHLGVEITYDKKVLDHFVQWKMLGKGEYAIGLEPCNATIDGRADARENGSLKYLAPGEEVVCRFRVAAYQ
ncbi:hypothetical protein BN3661_01861 [Eubacteriaceae bacterium CHKCI005]|nr:hypothetical protein BN3661_01861 [Eubacteriaceae bacterium CHKCI005]